MSARDFQATGRLKAALALIGVLALIVGLGAATAQAGGSTATTAKKKCKKKSRSAGVAKKCKKKPGAIVLPAPPALPAKPPTPPASGVPSTGVVAATLTWSTPSKVDLDLHVWDNDGSHAGWEPNPPPGAVVNGIGGVFHQGDSGLQANGGEQFTDSSADEHEVTIGVCYGDAEMAPPPQADWVLELNRSNGTTEQYTPNNPFTTLNQTYKLSDGEPTAYQPTDVCNGE